MKRLLFFASDYKIGLSQVLSDQLISIHKAGINYIAVAGEKEQEDGLTTTVENAGIELRRIQGLDEHQDFMRIVRNVVKLIKEYKIEVAHVQNNWQLAITYVALLKLWPKHKFEIAYTIHSFRNSNPMKAIIAKCIIGSALGLAARHVICMSDYLKNNFKLLSKNIRIIPLGVNNDLFIKDFIPPTTDALRLVFPAQFRPGKNQHMVIRAFAEYLQKSKKHNAELVLPGNGPLLEEMKALASSLGIGNHVKFPGFVSKKQIKEEYLKSNIAIVASNSETFGQCIVEPYVLGRCIISTNVGVAPEIIANGKNGWIYSDEHQLVEILLNLDNDSSQLIEIGNRNFRGRNAFSWTTVTNRYIQQILS